MASHPGKESILIDLFVEGIEKRLLKIYGQRYFVVTRIRIFVQYQQQQNTTRTMSASFGKIFSTFFSEYSRKTPLKLKVIDVYLVYVVMTGIVQALYCAMVGTFPFNSFLSGFISTVGSFVLAGNNNY